MNCLKSGKEKRDQTQIVEEVVRSEAVIAELVKEGNTLFVINHSGGKDSQALFIRQTAWLARLGVSKNHIVVIHADLAEVEFAGTKDHAQTTTQGYDFVCVKHSKGLSLLDLIEKRGKFPSPSQRYCTSSLKTGPINKAIGAELRKRGLRNVVSMLGIRAEESNSRAGLPVLELEGKLSLPSRKTKTVQAKPELFATKRRWFVWNPIFDLSAVDVFSVIKAAGQDPHWAYAKGMTRLSCCFCIMGSKADLKTAAKLAPELYAKYVALEKKIDQTMTMPKAGVRQFLPEVTGIEPNLNQDQTQTKGKDNGK